MAAVKRNWATLKEALEYAPIARSTLYQLIHEGRIPVLKVAGKPIKPFRVDLDELSQILTTSTLHGQQVPGARSLKFEDKKAGHRAKTKENLWQE